MPFYEFICPGCGLRKEVFTKRLVYDGHVCDNCGEEMRQTISLVATIFKGDGWTSNDAREQRKYNKEMETTKKILGEK